MLGEKELHLLKEELKPLLPTIRKAADSIKDEEISNYPLFVIFKGAEEAGIGLPLFGEEIVANNWRVNASTLEELATKKVVAMEKVERFSDIYKSNKNAICLVVWQNGAAQIVFLPLENSLNH